MPLKKLAAVVDPVREVVLPVAPRRGREPPADALRVHLEHVPPGSVVAHLLPKRGEVQDAQRAPLLRGIEPEALRVIHEAPARPLPARPGGGSPSVSPRL